MLIAYSAVIPLNFAMSRLPSNLAATVDLTLLVPGEDSLPLSWQWVTFIGFFEFYSVMRTGIVG